MKPIGPLMREHRLIERMVNLLKAQLEQIKRTNKVDTDFLLTGVDFMRFYADKTHHGKEEKILFRDLAKKNLNTDLSLIMDQLIAEHVQARAMVSELEGTTKLFLSGGQGSLNKLLDILDKIINFYPAHIDKEDKHFFYPCLDYFIREEQDKMLEEVLGV